MKIFEDWQYTNPVIDLGVIVSQDKLSPFESKNFIIKTSEKRFFQERVKVPVPTYIVKSLLTNTIYRDVIACSDVGMSGYEVNDVVVVASIRDIFFVILTRVDWLALQKWEQLLTEPRLPKRKVLTNKICAVSLEQDGSINIKFKIGEYDHYVRFGGYVAEVDDKVFISAGNDSYGEVFRMFSDGSIELSSKSEIITTAKEFISKGENFIFEALEQDGSVIYNIDNSFQISIGRLRDEKAYFELSKSKWRIEFGKRRHFKVLYSAENDKKGLFEMDFDDGLKIKADGELKKVSVYLNDYEKKKGRVEWVAKAETLRDELNALRNRLNEFVNKFNTHTHICSDGNKTTPPTGVPQSEFSEFTTDWYSKTMEVE